jgi:hypothetical protein
MNPSTLPESKTGPQYRSFSLGEVLFFATGGRLVSPKHQTDVDSVFDIAAYMTGVEDVHMLELQGIASQCRDAVIAQHPELEPIAEKFETGETEALWEQCNGDRELWHGAISDWLDSQQDEPGTLLELIPLADFERDPRSIMEQAVEAAGPNVHKLFVAHADEQGNITFPE